MSLRSKRSTYSHVGSYDSVAVRRARPEDEEAINRVAILDGRKAPAGQVLVAEADGQVIAALSVSDGTRAADPFSWTSDVMELMEMRAEQIAAAGAERQAVGAGSVNGLRTQLT
jgi:hypothetical protein